MQHRYNSTQLDADLYVRHNFKDQQQQQVLMQNRSTRSNALLSYRLYTVLWNHGEPSEVLLRGWIDELWRGGESNVNLQSMVEIKTEYI